MSFYSLHISMLRKSFSFFLSLFFLSVFSPVAHAQVDYENAFCSAYDYSVECYEHRYDVSKKVQKFVDAMKLSLATSSDEDALLRLRTMDDQL